MNQYSFLLSTFLTGLIYAILAVFIEKILIYFGIVRGNTIGLMLVAFFSAFIIQIVDYTGSVFLYGLFIILAGPLVANRFDLIDTIMKGRWWWKSQNNDQDQEM